MIPRTFVFFLTFTANLAWIAPSEGADLQSEQQPQISLRQRKTEGSKSQANLRLDVNLTLVPVSVTDAADRPITNLSKDRFRVLEDGVEQTITSLSSEESPVSLGLLFDSSGSMKNRIAASIEALKCFFQQTMPGDEFFAVRFNDEARLLGGFTTNPDEIFGRLGMVTPQGWTALLDAVAMANHQMKSAKHSRRVLLILSDGNDNNSRFSESEIKSMVLEGNLRVYGIGLSYKPRLLQQLAEVTGGNVLVAQNTAELPDVVRRLSAEIRSQYVLGYSSTNPSNDGKYRRVKVEIKPDGGPQLRASWRRGYYAPAQ